LAEEEPKTRPRPRIESLSDLIFGLALSIGAIALVSSPPTTPGALYKDITIFAFNFLILISIWLRYTRIMSVLPLETRLTVFLNLVLLFTVSMEPFLFNILRSGNSGHPADPALIEVASSLYGFDLGAMMLVMAIFTLALANEEKQLVPKDMIRQMRWEATTWIISAAIFLVSAFPAFGRVSLDGLSVTGLSLRQVLWLVAIIVVWLRRGAARIGGQSAQA